MCYNLGRTEHFVWPHGGSLKKEIRDDKTSDLTMVYCLHCIKKNPKYVLALCVLALCKLIDLSRSSTKSKVAPG